MNFAGKQPKEAVAGLLHQLYSGDKIKVFYIFERRYFVFVLKLVFGADSYNHNIQSFGVLR